MQLDFDKLNGLVPAIVQDYRTDKVLMLGFMNPEAFKVTKEKGQVTFYSRSKKRLWTKGETSGNFLNVKEIIPDCDNDTILIRAEPDGPACHTGDDTCFKELNTLAASSFLETLQELIQDRKANPREGSYTTELFTKGVKAISQKVGEEATEVVIDAVSGDIEKTKEECADLMYHFLVLLSSLDLSLQDVVEVLKGRHK